MFNFFVTGLDITEPRGKLIVYRDRVFLHTNPSLQKQFTTGNMVDVGKLMNLPSIFTNESSGDPLHPGIARIGNITKIESISVGYEISYRLDHAVPPIPNAVLEALGGELDFVIGGKGFDDFHTSHWAVKDADLFYGLFTKNTASKKPKTVNLQNWTTDPKLVSVMMPFDRGFNEVFATLKEAASFVGMKCQRADDIWDNDVLFQDVLKLIATAQVVICDLSKKNANVFYETGIAHALDKNVILIAQHATDIPFDIAHIRHLIYLPNAEGLSTLQQRIQDRLKTILAS